MRGIEIINLGYNDWNGFYLTLIGIDFQGETRGFESALLGLYIASDWLIVDIFFIQIEFKLPLIK